MDKVNMTALVSAFSRAYHQSCGRALIFDDCRARDLFSPEEYAEIGRNMSQGINFFQPGFSGDEKAALDWVVERQLAPTPLARAAWAEHSLQVAVIMGAKQYLLLGAGFDTFAWRQPPWADGLRLLEIDLPEMQASKLERLGRAGLEKPDNLTLLPLDLNQAQLEQELAACPAFDPALPTFVSALGLAYYLSEDSFDRLLAQLALILSPGSWLALDYPTPRDQDGRGQRQAQLAAASGNAMQAAYGFDQLADKLSRQGFRVYQHLTPAEMTEQFFAAYNLAEPEHTMTAFANVNYCLASKK